MADSQPDEASAMLEEGMAHSKDEMTDSQHGFYTSLDEESMDSSSLTARAQERPKEEGRVAWMRMVMVGMVMVGALMLPLGRLLRGAQEAEIGVRLRPERHVFREAKVLEFEWVVEKGWRSPDGVLKEVFLVNGAFPGPTIEARTGDGIVVRHGRGPGGDAGGGRAGKRV
ncbi:hypothetical protein CDD82_2566 [Ophiocordyceps australis]|uniref:Plastocyanin-like domain-containing protein n=1 Tax=Ophiocordyceps australis TaxID=1399860 RepID=A0A2C5XUF7_9HYPO|nr:hypothetical protein CDD82_2566 [Ophiocordyceps australis]